MTTRLSCLAVAASLMVSATAANAWTAVAYSKESGVSYLYYKAKSQQEAENEAMSGCRRQASHCVLLGETVDGPVATVIVKGEKGISRGSSRDPNEALQIAMAQCRQQYSNCRMVSAAWDGGTHLMAVAIDKEAAWAGNSEPTAEQARESALNACRKNSRAPEHCMVFHLLTGPGWIAIARSETSTGVGISVRSSEKASINAHAECEQGGAVGGKICSVPQIFHNTAGMPEPASYRHLVTLIHSDRAALAASAPPFIRKEN